MRDCLTKAMAAAGVGPEHIGYVNAHGTSTPLNDKFETMAYKRAFGAHAPHIKISSTKGATGHLLGAAGGVEAAVACKVLQTGSVPPTLNLHDPDPECDLDYVPTSRRPSTRRRLPPSPTTWASAATTPRSSSSSTRRPDAGADL